MAQKTEFENIEMPRWGEPAKWVGVNDAIQGPGAGGGAPAVSEYHTEACRDQDFPFVASCRGVIGAREAKKCK